MVYCIIRALKIMIHEEICLLKNDIQNERRGLLDQLNPHVNKVTITLENMGEGYPKIINNPDGQGL